MNVLASYEAILNYGAKLSLTQIFLTGAQVSRTVGTVNIFNLGVAGYAILAFMLFSGCMFVKELLSFQKYLYSLSHNETPNAGGEKQI
jgi:hypothetical protein